MKVKLDENITAAAVGLLTDHGHDVDTVPQERLTGVSDTKLIEACRADGRMLVTFDIGCGDVRAYPPGSHPRHRRSSHRRSTTREHTRCTSTFPREP